MNKVLITLFLAMLSMESFGTLLSPREVIFKTDRQVYSLSKIKDPIEKADKLRRILNNFTRFIVKKGIEYNNRLSSGSPLSGAQLEVLYRFIPTYRNILIQAQIDLKALNEAGHEEKLLYLHNHLKLLQSLRTIHKAYFRPDEMRTQIHNAFRKAEQSSVTRDEILKLINQVASKDNQENLKKLYRDLIVNGQSVSSEGDQLTELIKRNSLGGRLESEGYINIWTYTFFDGLARFGNNLEYMLSKGFGNVMGEVKFRKGFLYKNTEALAEFKPRLMPLDIIVERSPFALTDMTIPGHWTHPAIWLGTEEQLKDLGIWYHPIFKPYQKMIKAGKNVLEALRPGIQINPLASYFNTDEILHMRVPGILQDKERMLAVYQRALGHYGQKYDFNFDAASTDVIVCSELIFQAFGNINWPADKVLGRHSITPDNIVEIIFYEDSPVEFVSIFGVNEQKSMYELDKDEMMHMMGFSLDKSKTLEDGEKRYNKEVTECKIKSSRVRVGSRREKRLKINKCDQVLKPAVYKSL
ncbi:MAG: hypothetical protein CME70_15210 [Halobacteriovorax sp.]|nr:hypothetical protein [Halobacteriovorax sp.]